MVLTFIENENQVFPFINGLWHGDTGLELDTSGLLDGLLIYFNIIQGGEV